MDTNGAHRKGPVLAQRCHAIQPIRARAVSNYSTTLPWRMAGPANGTPTHVGQLSYGYMSNARRANRCRRTQGISQVISRLIRMDGTHADRTARTGFIWISDRYSMASSDINGAGLSWLTQRQ